MFDEPTSSLTEEEVEHLFRIIRMLRDRGCGIIYISHKMAEILRISDQVTIMRDGKWITTRDAADLTTDEIIRLMVGRELTNRYPPKNTVIGDELLRVEHLTGEYVKLKDVSFTARKGEILGIAGLDGSDEPLCFRSCSVQPPKKAAKSILTANTCATEHPANPSKTALPISPRNAVPPAFSGFLIFAAIPPSQALIKIRSGRF